MQKITLSTEDKILVMRGYGVEFKDVAEGVQVVPVSDDSHVNDFIRSAVDTFLAQSQGAIFSDCESAFGVLLDCITELFSSQGLFVGSVRQPVFSDQWDLNPFKNQLTPSQQ